jgi:sulfate transport system substrate-binding protein
LLVEKLGSDQFDIVIPSLSILAEPPVALIDKNVDRHGTSEVAQAYLQYLYSPEGQRIAAKHYYRPRHPEYADAKDMARFPKLELVTLQDTFGSWAQAQQKHFAEGGVFDQMQAER